MSGTFAYQSRHNKHVSTLHYASSIHEFKKALNKEIEAYSTLKNVGTGAHSVQALQVEKLTLFEKTLRHHRIL